MLINDSNLDYYLIFISVRGKIKDEGKSTKRDEKINEWNGGLSWDWKLENYPNYLVDSRILGGKRVHKSRNTVYKIMTQVKSTI